MNLEDFQIVKIEPPHDKIIWVKILCKIKNNTTGEIRDYYTDGIWNENYDCFSDWIWEEGNFSCDCNISLFFGDKDDTCGEIIDIL